MRYLEAGAGKPVVLLHAFPLGAEQWLPQLVRPAPGLRLVAPDLRGLGGSDPGVAAGGITMDTFADDVLELMAHIEMPRAAVVGLSMGGYVALAMLRRAPGRLTALMLADTRATSDGIEAQAARDRMLDLLDRSGVAGVGREMLPKLLGATTRQRQPDLADAVERLILMNSPDGVGTAIRAMKFRADSTDLLAGIAVPTIVACGEEDVITQPAECEALGRAIPGARFALIAGAGHLSNVENPQAFTAALSSLVNAQPTSIPHESRTD